MISQATACLTCHRAEPQKWGCCRKCFEEWQFLVDAGDTTWGEIQAQGKATPPLGGGQPSQEDQHMDQQARARAGIGGAQPPEAQPAVASHAQGDGPAGKPRRGAGPIPQGRNRRA